MIIFPNQFSLLCKTEVGTYNNDLRKDKSFGSVGLLPKIYSTSIFFNIFDPVLRWWFRTNSYLFYPLEIRLVGQM